VLCKALKMKLLVLNILLRDALSSVALPQCRVHLFLCCVTDNCKVSFFALVFFVLFSLKEKKQKRKKSKIAGECALAPWAAVLSPGRWE